MSWREAGMRNKIWQAAGKNHTSHTHRYSLYILYSLYLSFYILLFSLFFYSFYLYISCVICVYIKKNIENKGGRRDHKRKTQPHHKTQTVESQGGELPARGFRRLLPIFLFLCLYVFFLPLWSGFYPLHGCIIVSLTISSG